MLMQDFFPLNNPGQYRAPLNVQQSHWVWIRPLVHHLIGCFLCIGKISLEGQGIIKGQFDEKWCYRNQYRLLWETCRSLFVVQVGYLGEREYVSGAVMLAKGWTGDDSDCYVHFWSDIWSRKYCWFSIWNSFFGLMSLVRTVILIVT